MGLMSPAGNKVWFPLLDRGSFYNLRRIPETQGVREQKRRLGVNFARKAQGALPCPARGTCPPRSSSAMLRAPSLPADIRPQFPRGTPAQGPGREGAEMAPLPATHTYPDPGPQLQPSSRAPRRASVSRGPVRAPTRAAGPGGGLGARTR